MDLHVQQRADFQRVWKMAHGDRAQARPVDFNRHDVLAVFLGMKPSTGYNIAISNIMNNVDPLDVNVWIAVPAPGVPAGPVYTSPVQFVQIPKMGMPVVFHHEVVQSAGR
jgi:hypothetical protein